MELFPMLQLFDPDLLPERTKLHLASWNGEQDPLDEFLGGRFDEWQAWQTRRNFSRPLVVSVIALPEADKWVYAGAFNVLGVQRHSESLVRYNMTVRSSSDEMKGRLIVRFRRTGRQSYLFAENVASMLLVSEVRPEPLSIGEFPGYTKVHLSKKRLDIVVSQRDPSWRGALRSVAGVYVIGDTATGRLYIGSATGIGGIWARWEQYSITGHGGNLELVQLLKDKGSAYASNFMFGILEIADVTASETHMLQRETHWKKVLLTRGFGYNRN